MPDTDISIVKQIFNAFNARDLPRLYALSGEDLIVHNAVTGAIVGHERYEGREALASYLADVDLVWDCLELRPRTYKSTHGGQVLVAGSVLAKRGSETREVPAAWIWSVADGHVVYVRVLRTPDSYRLLDSP